MTEQENQTSKGLMVDEDFWKSISPMFRSFGISVIGVVIAFARYTVETFLAVGVFGVLVVASWVARWLNTTVVGNSIPELVTVFKYLEFFLLSVGILLFAVFIIRNTVLFIKPFVMDILRIFDREDQGKKVSNRRQAQKVVTEAAAPEKEVSE